MLVERDEPVDRAGLGWRRARARTRALSPFEPLGWYGWTRIVPSSVWNVDPPREMLAVWTAGAAAVAVAVRPLSEDAADESGSDDRPLPDASVAVVDGRLMMDVWTGASPARAAGLLLPRDGRSRTSVACGGSSDRA